MTAAVAAMNAAKASCTFSFRFAFFWIIAFRSFLSMLVFAIVVRSTCFWGPY